MTAYFVTLFITFSSLVGNCLLLVLLRWQGLDWDTGITFLVNHPIVIFPGYYVLRSLTLDTISYFGRRPIYVEKHLLFGFQLLLFVLLYDILNRIAFDPFVLTPGLFVSVLFIGDLVVAGGIRMVKSELDANKLIQLDQFTMEVLRLLLWFLIIPTIYFLALAYDFR